MNPANQAAITALERVRLEIERQIDLAETIFYTLPGGQLRFKQTGILIGLRKSSGIVQGRIAALTNPPIQPQNQPQEKRI